MSGALRVEVISLKNAATRSRMWRKIEQDAKLRASIFGRVQRSKRLQVFMLRALANHSKLSQQFLEELVPAPRLRGKLFRLAGQKD